MPHLVVFNIRSINGNNHFRLVRKLQQHLQLAVRSKARQHTRSVIIIEQLATKLQIQLVTKLADALLDML